MKTDGNITLRALQMALDNGADQASVTYECADQSSFKARGKDMDSIFRSQGSSLSLQLYVNGRYGCFSTNMLSDGDLMAFIRTSVGNVEMLARDSCRRLPDPSFCFRGELPDLKQYDPEIESVDSGFRRKVVLDCASEAGSDDRVVSMETEYDDLDDFFALADSNGFFKTLRQTQFSLSADCSIKGEGKSKYEGFWYDGSMFLKDFNVTGVGRMALKRAADRMGASKLPSGKYTAVLENTVSSRVLSPVVDALQGGALYQQDSFLNGKLGERVFPGYFTLVDDPLRPGFFGSRPFDSEGVATRRRKIIDCGVVASYYLDTYYAARLGMEQTVESPSVLYIERSGLPEGLAGDLGSMMQEARNGILVTGFNGGNCDGATGDFSYGIEGFYFEHGKILYPISGMNMTGNMLSLWNGFAAAGGDPRKCAKWQIPCLMFREVDFNGN